MGPDREYARDDDYGDLDMFASENDEPCSPPAPPHADATRRPPPADYVPADHVREDPVSANSAPADSPQGRAVAAHSTWADSVRAQSVEPESVQAESVRARSAEPDPAPAEAPRNQPALGGWHAEDAVPEHAPEPAHTPAPALHQGPAAPRYEDAPLHQRAPAPSHGHAAAPPPTPDVYYADPRPHGSGPGVPGPDPAAHETAPGARPAGAALRLSPAGASRRRVPAGPAFFAAGLIGGIVGAFATLTLLVEADRVSTGGTAPRAIETAADRDDASAPRAATDARIDEQPRATGGQAPVDRIDRPAAGAEPGADRGNASRGMAATQPAHTFGTEASQSPRAGALVRAGTEASDTPALAGSGAVTSARGPGSMSGRWTLSTRVESSALRGFEGLSLGYDVQLDQSGSDITGRGFKVTENGATLAPAGRTPIDIQGTVNGNRLTLSFVERGTRRSSRGTFVLFREGDSVLRGRFASDAARSSGSVEATRR